MCMWVGPNRWFDRLVDFDWNILVGLSIYCLGIMGIIFLVPQVFV
jgi:hypothetical protein